MRDSFWNGSTITPSSRSSGSPTMQHAARIASLFFDELVRQGTTTAVAYCSVHKGSAEAFFTEAERRDMRMIGGKVMMDRNAPPALLDTPQAGYDDTKALIAKWHGRGRQLYAISPRFAVTSTPEQLEMSGALVAEHPDCYMQTHLSENHARDLDRRRNSFRGAATIPTSTSTTGCSGRRASSAIASISNEREADAHGGERLRRGLLSDLEPLPRQRPLQSRPAAPSRDAGAGTRSRPISAEARAIPCCGPSTRATRCSISRASATIRCARFTR